MLLQMALVHSFLWLNNIPSTSLVAQRVKNLLVMQETQFLIPGLRRSPGEGNGNPLQYSCLGNTMARVVWQAIVHGVCKESDTTEQLRIFLYVYVPYLPYPLICCWAFRFCFHVRHINVLTSCGVELSCLCLIMLSPVLPN